MSLAPKENIDSEHFNNVYNKHIRNFSGPTPVPYFPRGKKSIAGFIGGLIIAILILDCLFSLLRWAFQYLE